MRCVYHPDQEAVCQCRACSMGLCSSCAERKKLPAMAFAAGAVARYANPRAEQTGYFCRRGCEDYRRLFKRQSAQGSWGNMVAILWIGSVAIGLVGVLFAMLLLVGIVGVGAVAVDRAAVIQERSAALRREIAPDLSGVALDQRYVFDHGSYLETWTIDELKSDKVGYRITRRSKNSGKTRDHGRTRWRAPIPEPGIRKALNRGTATRPFAVTGAEFQILEVSSGVATTTYALRDGRLVFPGILRRDFHGRPELGSALIEVAAR